MKRHYIVFALIALLFPVVQTSLFAQESEATTHLSVIYDWQSKPDVVAITNDGRFIVHYISHGGTFVRDLQTGDEWGVKGIPVDPDAGIAVFSPDGSKLVYNQVGGGARMMSPGLYMVDSNGMSAQEVILAPSDPPPSNYPPDLHKPIFSPDGSQIALQVVPRLRGGGNKSFIGLLPANAEKQNPKRLIQGIPEFWSTDGKAIFYTNKDGGFSRFNIGTMNVTDFDIHGEILGKVPSLDAAFVKSDNSITVADLRVNNRQSRTPLSSEAIEAAKSILLADAQGNALQSIKAVGSQRFLLTYGKHIQLVSWGPVTSVELERAKQQQARDQERKGRWALEHLSACIKVIDGTLDHYVLSKEGWDLGLPAISGLKTLSGRYVDGRLRIEPIVRHIDTPDEPVETPEELSNENLPTIEEAKLIYERHEALENSNCEKSTVRILTEDNSELTQLVVDVLYETDSISIKLLRRQITWAEAARRRQQLADIFKIQLTAAWNLIQAGSDSYHINEPDHSWQMKVANERYNNDLKEQWEKARKKIDSYNQESISHIESLKTSDGKFCDDPPDPFPGMAWEGAKNLETDTVYSVLQAVDKLETAYDVPITYEDSDPFKTNLQPPRSFAVTYGLVESISSFNGNQSELRKSLTKKGLTSLLEQYNAARGVETFYFVEKDTGFHVISSPCVSKSVLDTPISFEAKERTAAEAVAEICRQTSGASGQELTPGTEDGLPYLAKTNIGAANEPARAVLDRLFGELQIAGKDRDLNASKDDGISGLSWRTDCNGGPCLLNLHRVPPEGPVTEPHPVTVNDMRPVAAALERLEKIYLLPITYEDPLRVNDWEKSVNAKGHRTPKTEAFSFTYGELPPDIASVIRTAEMPLPGDTLEVRKKLARESIASVLQNYADAHDGEMFSIVEADKGFHVVPTKFINENGQLQEYHSLLNTPISIPPGKRNIHEFMGDFLGALSAATGQKIQFDGQMFMNSCSIITISASNESALSILERLLGELPVGYASEPNKAGGTHDLPSSRSWELLSWPKIGTDGGPLFMLRFHNVTPENRQAVNMGTPCGALHN